MDAAIGFATGLEEVDVVICGVETRVQLEQIVEAAGVEVRRDWFAGIGPSDPALVDPSTWPEQT